MTKQTVLIVDIETVRDVAISPPDEAKWPPPIGWKVVAIGILSAIQERDQMKIEKLACGTGNEATLLSSFWSFFDTRQPTVVTWNGRSFDMPVLLQRAMLHGIQVKGWYSKGRSSGYSYRYSRHEHCDLLDVFTDYGAVPKVKLETMASALGYAGKLGKSGSDVEGMFNEERMGEIAEYCEGDVLNLYSLYLRWLHLIGELTTDALDRSHRALVSYIEASGTHRHHVAGFIANSPNLSIPSSAPNQFGSA